MRRLMAVRGGARDFRARPLCATHATYIIFLSKNISISGFDQSQTILILTIDRVKTTIIICKSLYSYFFILRDIISQRLKCLTLTETTNAYILGWKEYIHREKHRGFTRNWLGGQDPPRPLLPTFMRYFSAMPP